jgi:thiosulfate/3-mercaptopyruvate sulfurtransferase
MYDLKTEYTNPELIWSTDFLFKAIDRKDLVIIDTRTAEAFANGHIPNAKHFDLYFVNCDDTDLKPLASFTRMWANLLGWRGVRETDTIIFYGDFLDMCAARGFWFLEYLGHNDVHVLNGGINAWIAENRPIETSSKKPQPTKFNFNVISSRIATYATILEKISTKNSVILDNRSYSEFIGIDKRAKYGGAIPGASHLDWENLYEHDSGHIKSALELQNTFNPLKISPKLDITLYCNTGYRSAYAYLALRLLGYHNIRNYLGSWQEWGNREGLPIWQPPKS